MAREREALKILRNNKDILIKPADKGGATVILNKTSYLKEAYRQLNNLKYYIRLREPLYHSNHNKIVNILNQMEKEHFINKKQLKYLSGPTDYKPRYFYLLPKIHKKRENWPWPDMPEGRPICSDVNSETYRVSAFIDHFLNPLSCLHDSYVKNSYDFVKKIRNFKMGEGWLLVTADVASLYTNMHLDRTMDCVREVFRNRPDARRPDKYILDLLELILKNNDFEFNGETFQQIMGTAMGKIFSPSLANMYLLELDGAAINDFFINPLLFFRYLDGVFFVWPGTMDELLEFERFLNGLIPDISLKCEFLGHLVRALQRRNAGL